MKTKTKINRILKILCGILLACSAAFVIYIITSGINGSFRSTQRGAEETERPTASEAPLEENEE